MTPALRNLIDLAMQSAVVLAGHGHARLATELNHAAMDCDPMCLPRKREAGSCEHCPAHGGGCVVCAPAELISYADRIDEVEDVDRCDSCRRVLPAERSKCECGNLIPF